MHETCMKYKQIPKLTYHITIIMHMKIHCKGIVNFVKVLELLTKITTSFLVDIR